MNCELRIVNVRRKNNKRRHKMGYVRAKIEIGNPRNPTLERIKKDALVDTGEIIRDVTHLIR